MRTAPFLEGPECLDTDAVATQLRFPGRLPDSGNRDPAPARLLVQVGLRCWHDPGAQGASRARSRCTCTAAHGGDPGTAWTVPSRWHPPAPSATCSLSPAERPHSLAPETSSTCPPPSRMLSPCDPVLRRGTRASSQTMKGEDTAGVLGSRAPRRKDACSGKAWPRGPGCRAESLGHAQWLCFSRPQRRCTRK